MTACYINYARVIESNSSIEHLRSSIMDYIEQVIADFMEIGYTEKEATALAWAKFVEAI